MDTIDPQTWEHDWEQFEKNEEKTNTETSKHELPIPSTSTEETQESLWLDIIEYDM